MTDQASALRQIVENIKKQRTREQGTGARIISIASGKGGVGKTNLAVNMAISLCKKGLRVLIIDADFGLSNVDVVLGVAPEYDLSYVVHNNKELSEVISEGPGGLKFVSGGSGVFDLINLRTNQLDKLLEKLYQIDDIADIIIIDTGAGISENIQRMLCASNEILVVTTPEPTAIMDAYALIKTVASAEAETHIRLIVNKADSAAEGINTLAKFSAVVRLYLKTDLEELGFVLTDSVVSKAVRLQKPFVLSFPKSMASKNIDAITWKLINASPEYKGGGIKSFFEKLGNSWKK